MPQDAPMPQKPSPATPAYTPQTYQDAKLTRSMVTPEGIRLNVQLADAGDRIAGFLIDFFIYVICAILVSIAIGYMEFLGDEGRVVVSTVFGFLFWLFYWPIFEVRPKAASPGKRLMKTRVAARNGGRLTANAIFARNAMRLIEFWLPLQVLFYSMMVGGGLDGIFVLLLIIWCGVFVLFPLFNRDRLRIGDLLAGTWVVKLPKPVLAEDLSGKTNAEIVSQFVFTDRQLQAYGIHELHVLEDVLRRRDPETLLAVAERIQAKIDWTPAPQESTEEFLSAYYRALRQQLEGGMLFGRRKKDKFDQ